MRRLCHAAAQSWDRRTRGLNVGGQHQRLTLGSEDIPRVHVATEGKQPAKVFEGQTGEQRGESTPPLKENAHDRNCIPQDYQEPWIMKAQLGISSHISC